MCDRWGWLFTLAITAPAIAQEVERAEAPSAPTTTVGVDVVSKYFFRGILQADTGAIVQPYGDVGIGLYESDATLRSIDYTVGVWNSLHSGPTGSGADSETASPTAWYELDFYNGLSFGLGDATSVGVTYTILTSPNQSFDTQYLLDITVAYDDTARWSDFDGLAAHVTLSRELHGSNDLGDSLGWYLELGITPSLAIGSEDDAPITLRLPVTAGFSLSDYYEDENGEDSSLGFVDIGIDAGMPIGAPGRFGQMTLAASVHALLLGETTRTINSGDGIDFVGTVGCTLDW